MHINPISKFRKMVQPPPDKSIMQRAIIVGGLFGEVTIKNPSFCGDCLSALNCVTALGADVSLQRGVLTVRRPAEFALKSAHSASGVASKNTVVLNAGNSATALRLVSGASAGLGLAVTLSGDSSLKRRDMNDTAAALMQMGAKITCSQGFAPLVNEPTALHGIDFYSVRPSAQVKSAILLAALSACGTTRVYEKVKTRDHTERLLAHLGVNITWPAITSSAILDVASDAISMDKTCLNVTSASINSADTILTGSVSKNTISDNTTADEAVILNPKVFNCGDLNLHPPLRGEVTVPGDFSSAAFLIAAALLTPGSHLFIKNTGLNYTRTGMLRVLQKAGADITAEITGISGGEEYGNIQARYSSLKPFRIGEKNLPSLIDEVAVLAVIACRCSGVSVFSDLAPLRNKESDRANAICTMLKAFGAKVKLMGDSLEITGNDAKLPLCPKIQAKDHRIIMAAAVAGAANSGCEIENPDCAAVSYPDFFAALAE